MQDVGGRRDLSQSRCVSSPGRRTLPFLARDEPQHLPVGSTEARFRRGEPPLLTRRRLRTLPRTALRPRIPRCVSSPGRRTLPFLTRDEPQHFACREHGGEVSARRTSPTRRLRTLPSTALRPRIPRALGGPGRGTSASRRPLPAPFLELLSQKSLRPGSQGPPGRSGRHRRVTVRSRFPRPVPFSRDRGGPRSEFPRRSSPAPSLPSCG
jgi:hypothetical protein